MIHLRIILFLFAFSVSILGGCNIQETSMNLDEIYKEFKNAETSRQRMDIFLKFSHSREESLKYILKKLEMEKDDSVKGDIITSLLILADRNTAEKIMPYMHDPNCRIRHYTLSTIVALKYKNIDDLLKTAINDECNAVQTLAIRSFGDIGNKSAIPFLENYRKTTNDEVIDKAIERALEKLNKEGMGSNLQNSFLNKD